MDKLIPVHMRLRQQTIKKVNRLQRRLSSPTKTAAVRTAIEIAELVVTTMCKGGSAILEDKQGHQKVIVLPVLKS